MASPELSSDTIFKILTQITSLKSLDTCKVVSKEWKKMIYESSFTSIHCEGTKIKSGYFIQDIRHNEYVSKFVSCDSTLPKECLPKKVKILACASNQGILCCEKQLGKQQCRYYVCIPMTREWRALPNPKIRHRTTAMAMIVLRSQPLRFKIIRLSRRRIIEPLKQLSSYRVEIFDSEIRGWKEEQEDVILPYDEFICTNPAVSASNALHWLTTEANVLSYDVAKNSFDVFSLPKLVKEDINGSYRSKHLSEYQGKLGFTCLTEKGDIDLWTVDDIKIHSWKKEIKSGNIESLGEVATHPSPAGFYNSDVAFLTAFCEVGFYMLQDCSFRTVKLNELDDAREVFRFRSDIEPANLRLI
ncbi:F-box protein At5g49610-like [Henckelia pumila]|uniref:F-box protein At5g49610-like n=1 Tax=Henckelia pumila TaxID=405737 RepID=UPI003C6E3848